MAQGYGEGRGRQTASGFHISGKHAALALNGFGREVVQRGIANTYYAEISGAPPSPVAEIVEIDIPYGRGERIEWVGHVVMRSQ